MNKLQYLTRSRKSSFVLVGILLSCALWQLSSSLLAQSSNRAQPNENEALLESYRHVEVA